MTNDLLAYEKDLYSEGYEFICGTDEADVDLLSDLSMQEPLFYLKIII